MRWYNILHKDWCFIQLSCTPLNRTLIFHQMRNLVPLHKSVPCLNLNRIDKNLIPQMSRERFPWISSWLNIATARQHVHVAGVHLYLIHKIILLYDKLTQICSANLLWHHGSCEIVNFAMHVCNGTIRYSFVFHRLVYNKLNTCRCCTTY